nr:putative integron gene cassette protein [uncultured bacterium]
MLRLFLILAIALVAVGINSCALHAGSSNAGWRHRSATVFGIVGIFFILCVPISLLYALGNYFLEPARDTSLIFLSAIGGASICTLASLFFCYAIWRHDARSGA